MLSKYCLFVAENIIKILSNKTNKYGEKYDKKFVEKQNENMMENTVYLLKLQNENMIFINAHARVY